MNYKQKILAALIFVFAARAHAENADALFKAMQEGHCKTALPPLVNQAAEGDAASLDRLALAAAVGLCMKRDDALALSGFQQAAAQGYANSQFSIGVMYTNGQGVPQDYAQAVAWFRKAAEQGYEKAEHNLGVMFENGQGVAQDYAQAVAWYRKAAEQGSINAQVNLGVMYENGRGVAQDYAQAVAWYRKAAEQGDATAQQNLGVMYENGRGVAKAPANTAETKQPTVESATPSAPIKLPAGLLEQIIGAVVILSSIWVFFDAKSIGVKKDLTNGMFAMSAGMWFLACLFLWIISFPAYLIKRGEFKRLAQARGVTSGQSTQADIRIRTQHVSPQTQSTTSGQSEHPHSASSTAIDDLHRLADLLQKGVLSREEFDAKKKQLLAL